MGSSGKRGLSHPSQVIAQQPASCQSTASSTKDSGNSANSNSANNGSHAPEVRFTYNDRGERVYKESHDNVSFYLNPHYTEKSDDAYKHILIGTTRLTTKEVKKEAEYEDDQYYYHPDHLGSSSFVTDTEGKLEEHLEYFPFGETWVEEESSLPIAFRFTAKELDSETNLYYFGARYYDPRTSVWQSADPILNKYLPTGNKEQDAQLAGMGGVFNSLNLAMYTYGHQNPMRFVDPDGNLSIEAVLNHNRNIAGHLIVRDDFGKIILVVPTLGKGMHGDVMRENGNTPTGTYKIKDTVESKTNKEIHSYGPERIRLEAKSGDALESERTGIDIHGGDSSPAAGHQGLKSTLGCLRVSNENIEKIDDIIQSERQDRGSLGYRAKAFVMDKLFNIKPDKTDTVKVHE